MNRRNKFSLSKSFFPSWKCYIRRNVNLDISIVTMRRVAIIFFEQGAVKYFMQKIFIARHFMIIFLLKKLCLIAKVSNINRIV